MAAILSRNAASRKVPFDLLALRLPPPAASMGILLDPPPSAPSIAPDLRIR